MTQLTQSDENSLRRTETNAQIHITATYNTHARVLLIYTQLNYEYLLGFGKFSDQNCAAKSEKFHMK
jgi:hypothetical protein